MFKLTFCVSKANRPTIFLFFKEHFSTSKLATRLLSDSGNDRFLWSFFTCYYFIQRTKKPKNTTKQEKIHTKVHTHPATIKRWPKMILHATQSHAHSLLILFTNNRLACNRTLNIGTDNNCNRLQERMLVVKLHWRVLDHIWKKRTVVFFSSGETVLFHTRLEAVEEARKKEENMVMSLTRGTLLFPESCF